MIVKPIEHATNQYKCAAIICIRYEEACKKLRDRLEKLEDEAAKKKKYMEKARLHLEFIIRKETDLSVWKINNLPTTENDGEEPPEALY